MVREERFERSREGVEVVEQLGVGGVQIGSLGLECGRPSEAVGDQFGERLGAEGLENRAQYPQRRAQALVALAG